MLIKKIINLANITKRFFVIHFTFFADTGIKIFYYHSGMIKLDIFQ